MYNISDGLLKGGGESGLCMCVYAALANHVLRALRVVLYSTLFSCITPFSSFFLPASKSDPGLCLNSDISWLAGWLLYLVACHVSMYPSFLSHLVHTTLSRNGKHPVFFNASSPATNFLFLNSTQLNKKNVYPTFKHPELTYLWRCVVRSVFVGTWVT